MSSPKLEVPAELREIAEKAMDQAERALGMFLDAAKKSMESIPHPATEISKKALSFTEENMKIAFDHARKVIRTNNLQDALQVQSEFLKRQIENAGAQIRKMTEEVMTAPKKE